MKSEYVIAAFKGFLAGRDDDATNVIRQMVAAESSSGNVLLSRRLNDLLRNHSQMIRLPDAPPSIEFWSGQRSLESVILSDGTASEVNQFIREWKNADRLLEANIPLRRVVMLSGPSGNGKTTLAKAIATSLNLPIGIVRYEEAIDSFRGESGKQIAKILDFANKSQCVLFFDEADSIVSARHVSASSGAAAEDNRTVNQILMKIDAMSGKSIVIFATNMGSEIDSALIRRTSMNLTLGAPMDRERAKMVRLMQEAYPRLAENPEWASTAMFGSSLAGIESFAHSAMRQIVLSEVA